ncbi:DUF3703 domain-containing protein [Aestuariibacter halophilus]|uniref:DUF3703 domain-containing protein n=1 Tax=Fluctibacter halophilus TaxID=226011 RepID=A0ABS8GB65_9ALTE|nr:DUF3703 domain-containing protein [Aestuariibacter halophilus]MCC2616974.1 DUF3703 domain-containing protein [Aestuariibacter halophilus]
MSAFSRAIAAPVRDTLDAARQAQQQGNYAAAFRHLEDAHVLGQLSTYWHWVAHWRMLALAGQHRQWREVRGQCLRLVGALSKTWLGWLPRGNTGGSNVSPFRPMPIRPALKRIIRRAQNQG